MERIENPEKYQSKDPLRKRIQKFLLKYMIWVPIVCLFMGLLIVLLIYKHHTQNEVRLGVNYGETVERDDYKRKKPKSRLQQFQDKIFDKDQVKRRGRYERIVSGKDMVSVDFGQITYAEGEKQPPEKPEKKDTLQQLDPPKTTPKPARTRKKTLPVTQIAVADTVQQDTLTNKVVQNPFASLRLVSQIDQKYTLAYIYGDQELEPGSFIKLRLGEPVEIQGSTISKGTVFTGKISLRANAIYVKVNRIERYHVNYELYDSDYSHGIVIDRSKSQDMENAVNSAAYRSAGRSVVDLPYDILQDVTRSIIKNKRTRQKVIKLNDGYTVYLAKG